jgi:hypothetical protein
VSNDSGGQACQSRHTQGCNDDVIGANAFQHTLNPVFIHEVRMIHRVATQIPQQHRDGFIQNDVTLNIRVKGLAIAYAFSQYEPSSHIQIYTYIQHSIRQDMEYASLDQGLGIVRVFTNVRQKLHRTLEMERISFVRLRGNDREQHFETRSEVGDS